MSSVCIEPVERRRRIEDEPGLAAVLVDEPDRAVDVLGRLGMEADDRRAGLREVGHDAVDRLAPSGARRSARVACGLIAAHTSGPTVRFGT